MTFNNSFRRITLRRSLTLLVLAFGILSIIALFVNAQIFLHYAYENQRNAVRELVHNQASGALHDLRRLSRDLGNAIIKERAVTQAVNSNDLKQLRELLDDQFAQYFTTAGVLSLQKLYILDALYRVASASSKGYPVKLHDPLICRELIDQAKFRARAARLKSLSGLCSYDNLSFFGLLIPINLTPAGYILIVTDPTFAIRSLQTTLTDPIKIGQADNSLVFVAKDWPIDELQKDYLVVQHHHYFTNPDHSSNGKVAFTVTIARNTSEFADQIKNAVYRSSGVAFFVLAGALILIHYIQQKGIRPLKHLQEAAAKLSEGHYEIVEDKSFPEIEDVTKAYNMMTRKVSKLIEDLQVARNEANSANELKSRFLANMSHEIRTPLTAMLGFAESLRDDELADQEKRHHIDTIVKSGIHLRQIINDILDMSKIEAGKLEIEAIEVDVILLIHELRSIFGRSIAEKNLSFDINFKTPIPRAIISDAVRVKQVLLNLVSNAVKFTEHGSIRIDVMCEIDLKKLHFTITDTGIGLDAQEAERLFKPFQQANVSTTRKFGGTGLGLALSKQLAQMLGGDLTVESELRKGSQFTFSVSTGPLKHVHFHDKLDIIESEKLETKPVEMDLFQGHVLVAEDTPELQDLMRHYLTRFGIKPVIVNNGADAVDAALTQNFDLILMDIQMPVMDGMEAVTILRERGYQRPIVALTANAMRGDKERFLNAGCNDYLAKPVDRRRLHACMKAYLEKRQGATPLRSTLLDEDPEMAEMILRFIQSLPEIKSQLQTARTKKDWTQLSRIIHNVKGLGGSYGYAELTDIAIAIEYPLKHDQPENAEAQLPKLYELIDRIIAARDAIAKSA